MEQNNELMEVNSDSNNSSSEDEAEKVLESRAKELESAISDNHYLYDAHVELVNLYRKLGELKSMRLAYERFYEYFPLTPEIWLAWINDEKKLMISDNDAEYVLNLFDKAVKDYLSIKLWQEYAQYSIGASDIRTTREILERAITAGGLHAADGSLLWDTLRELELAHFSLLEDGTDAWKEQVERIVGIFRRQLSVPLVDMESTYTEWKLFLENLPKEHNIDPQPVEWGYKRALKNLADYKPFEEKLMITKNQGELYPIYQDYMKSVSDPSTIICLYERAVAQLCLEPAVWLDYCMYALKLGEPALNVSTRGLRNCPWSQDLWITKLRILEHLGKDKKDILSCFEEGISSLGANSLDLWLSYLEYVNRNSETKDKLYKLFDQAIDQLGNQSGKVVRWYARLLAKSGDVPKARQLWKQISSNPQNKTCASVWLEFTNFERTYGDEQHMRNIFQKGLIKCTDWPQSIADEWLMFERETGTLQDVLKCVEKCKALVKVRPQQMLEEEQRQQQQQGRKRKLDRNGEAEVKKVKIELNKKPPIIKDPKRTVFVSNLYPSITEKKLHKVFPNAVNIELVTDRLGKSRCYGYVQFSIEEEVMTALARDRELLDGRPIFISNCKPDKSERTKSFRYSTQTESNKLFIKNLPLNTTQDDLERIYQPFGAIAVRLVLQKSGQSKGLAYVEFADDENAKKAIQKTDNMKIQEHNISVAVSAPPKKGIEIKALPQRQAQRSRLQVPLVPRAVQKSHADLENNEERGKGGKTNDDFRRMLLNNK